MSQHHARFKDCEWYSKEYGTVTVGGAGGIGSWLSFFLARVGVPIHLYDFDHIDYTNLGGQLFGTHQMGIGKTRAIKNTVAHFCGDKDNKLITECGKFINQPVNPICFTGFDNMRAREAMFDKWYYSYVHNGVRLGQPCAFIDGRMSVESFQVYIVQPNEESVRKYRETLFSDSDLAEPMCSMKATSHIGAMIGSYMTQAFTNVVSNHNLGMDIRELPFKTAYEALFMDKIPEYEV